MDEISESLKKQYSWSFSSPDQNYHIDDPKVFFSYTEENNNKLSTDINFTRKMIVDEINNIKNDSAPGPDHFPVTLLKQCAEELSETLYILWR